MKTYLHFAPSDTFIFETIVPTSAGAIFACLILFLVAVADCYLCAAIGMLLMCTITLADPTKLRTRRLAAAYYFIGEADGSNDSGASCPKAPRSEIHTPIMAPTRFILSHELSCGTLVGLQSTIHYFLMLVCLIHLQIFSVILGVVLGKVAFGQLHR
ncbi:hypothetical protein C8R44DRAFT_628089 [Mycena epipterygia]|nr:hypothetical protein C8R44DRAFT_628089 [Mycena epipterygia]